MEVISVFWEGLEEMVRYVFKEKGTKTRGELLYFFFLSPRAAGLLLNYNQRPLRATYLHNVGVCAGSRTLRFTDEVGLGVRAAQTLVPRPQPPIAVRRSETHTVTLLTCEVSRCGWREDNKLTPPPSSTAAVFKATCIVQTWRRHGGLKTSDHLCANILDSCTLRTSHTAGEQADVEQGLVAELGRVVAEHGTRALNSHPFFLEPAHQPEQLTVTLEGVTAQVAGGHTGKQKHFCSSYSFLNKQHWDYEKRTTNWKIIHATYAFPAAACENGCSKQINYQKQTSVVMGKRQRV